MLPITSDSEGSDFNQNNREVENTSKAHPVTVEADLEDAIGKCREALAAPHFVKLKGRLPGAPSDARGWFDLLTDFPNSADRFELMQSALDDGANEDGVKLGHYAVLSALPVSLNRIQTQVLPDAVKRCYANFCREIAAREKHLEVLYRFEEEPFLFNDLAEMATLKQYPLGDFSFGFGDMPFAVVSASIHPMSLPRFLCHAICAMKGGGLTIFPHISFARKSLILRRSDYERALWLMAKTLQVRPELKGFCSLSWLHSSIVGKSLPHLAWIRDAFVELGAYMVDTRPAIPGRYGLAYKDPKRAKLYEEGKFCPRQTMVLWPRDDFLEWAAEHPEFMPEGEQPIVLAKTSGSGMRVLSPKSVPQTKRNSSVNLWNGHKTYHRIGKLKYAILVFLLPALLVAFAAAYTFGWLAAVPAFLVGFGAAHAFQYFFSQ